MFLGFVYIFLVKIVFFVFVSDRYGFGMSFVLFLGGLIFLRGGNLVNIFYVYVDCEYVVVRIV